MKAKTFNKSLWKEKGTHVWTFFCPFCSSQRRLPFRPRPGGVKHFSQVGIAAVFFMVTTWSWFSWKGIVSFVPFWIVFEAVYRARVRGAASCSQCGFDPFLYLTDAGRARQVIEQHWRKKFAEKGIPYPEKNPQPGIEDLPESARTPEAPV